MPRSDVSALAARLVFIADRHCRQGFRQHVLLAGGGGIGDCPERVWVAVDTEPEEATAAVSAFSRRQSEDGAGQDPVPLGGLLQRPQVKKPTQVATETASGSACRKVQRLRPGPVSYSFPRIGQARLRQSAIVLAS